MAPTKLTTRPLPLEFQKGKKFFCARIHKGLAMPLRNKHAHCFLMGVGHSSRNSRGYMALQARSGGKPCKFHQQVVQQMIKSAELKKMEVVASKFKSYEFGGVQSDEESADERA